MSTQLYPNSTPDGKAVPDAFLNAYESIIIPYTLSALGASFALWTASNDIRLIQVSSSSDCLLGFELNPIGSPANDTIIPNSIIIRPDIIYQIAMPSIYLSVIGLSNSGTLWVNKINPWNALQLQVQLGLL